MVCFATIIFLLHNYKGLWGFPFKKSVKYPTVAVIQGLRFFSLPYLNFTFTLCAGGTCLGNAGGSGQQSRARVVCCRKKQHVADVRGIAGCTSGSCSDAAMMSTV